jgi:hypothetical protein
MEQQRQRILPLLCIRYNLSEFTVDVMVRDQSGRIKHIPLLPTKSLFATPSNLHSLHELLGFWIVHMNGRFHSSPSPFVLTESATTIDTGGFIYKFFQLPRRSPLHYSTFIANTMFCNIPKPVQRYRVIRYPKVPGEHYPSNLAHVIKFFEAVVEVLRLGVVHGDLRLLNIVFQVCAISIESYLLFIRQQYTILIF